MNKNIQTAKEFCEKNKYRFTKPREQVLETIFSQDTPLSAYDILEILSEKKQINPPTVYRAIDFWSKHGFIHRVESISAYIACDIQHKHEGTQIIICNKCGITKEVNLINLNITDELREKESFLVTGWNFEVHGICASCSR
ncbi:Fur family transcriptional regulator [Francisella hispaniensis]|uniref:Transcriptional repressor n=1 Tax=Francisella hispaniensis FSC454 TaxID=1088883 RepID=A0AAC9J584_9GAMM|nr:Fur family transcriptional regulator [Francisella hispaniensis]APD50619.1 transcriptional repressor [Francisella hispaniensis FSC454]KYW82516.1 amino acid ABC transporter substrate-binding protein [Francisella hispaniensis FSC454]